MTEVALMFFMNRGGVRTMWFAALRVGLPNETASRFLHSV
jgi:hypothetical protein